MTPKTDCAPGAKCDIPERLMERCYQPTVSLFSSLETQRFSYD